jgi:hypothetical protein
MRRLQFTSAEEKKFNIRVFADLGQTVRCATPKCGAQATIKDKQLGWICDTCYTMLNDSYLFGH